MPVLHYWPVIGGLETWTKEIAERLSKGADVFVITGKVKGRPKREVLNGVKIYRTGLYSLQNLSYSSFVYILTTLPFLLLLSRRIIKKEKVNLLHCQGFLSSLVGWRLGGRFHLPYIITVQRIETKKGFWRKKVYKEAKVCIAASSAIKNYFREIGCQNIEVIPNGIDLARFQGLSRERERRLLGLTDEFAVITVARLEKVKGVDYLIKAFSILIKKISRAKLFVVGDGSERKQLEGLVLDLGLGEKVRFLGEVPNKEIPQYLAAADCFCLPSRREGFGIAVLEAMAAGVPVVATKVGGVPDIIENQKDGLLVESQNPKVLSAALLEIASNSGLAERLKQNAQLKVQQYNWSDISERVLSIYQSVSGGGQTPPLTEVNS